MPNVRRKSGESASNPLDLEAPAIKRLLDRGAKIEKEADIFEILPKSSNGTLAIRASGKLTADDYEKVLIPKLNDLFKDFKRLHVLIEFTDDFACWSSAEAAWDDAKIGLEHPNDFEKIALVAPPEWVKWGMKLYSLFVHGKVKAFPRGAEDEAWDWVREYRYAEIIGWRPRQHT